VLLLAVCFSLATTLQPRALQWNPQANSGNVLKVMFGDGRRLFADHFFRKADVYFHSGYYPTIFDHSQAPKDTRHMTSEEGEHEEGGDHEKEMDFLGSPRDWIERFGRHFIVTEHTHLAGGAEREILPWLRLSAELDPERVQTYTVAAYWLRSRLGRVADAETFLREGLRANPESPEILFELGRLYYQCYHDNNRARNLFEMALRKWKIREAGKKEPDLFLLEQIAVNLSILEQDAGNFSRAIELLQLAQKASPRPEVLQKQIDELKAKIPEAPAKP
jgi:tetratricopeptide (TPR) repeat protein